MKIELKKASPEDAELIWNMQIEAFAELLERYRDVDTNPGSEPIEKVVNRLKQPETSFYLIQADGRNVGAMRIRCMEDGLEKRISPLFVLPEYRNRGIAQQAITEAERIHGQEHWALETILQDKGNCYLYEKMEYQDTGRREVINDKLTLILYAK